MKTMIAKHPASRIFLAAALAASLAALFLLAPGAALAKSGTYVFDEYGLFTDEQFDALEAEAAAASSHDIGVYLLITDTMGGNSNPSSSQRNAFAKNYYTENSLGLGSGKDGIIFVIAVASRDYNTWGNGLPWTEALSDKGISAMEDHVTSYLHDNRWYEACDAYLTDIGSQLDYYAFHGKAQEPLDIIDWIIRIAIVLALPLIIAVSATASARSAMLTARQKTEAGDYLRAGSLVVTHSRDRYLHTTHTVTPRAEKSDGGGGWGGGGGSGGSGGGKF